MKEVVIVSACRTAIGAFGGSLKDSHTYRIGSAVMREAIQRAIRWSKTFKDCWLKEMTGGKRHDKYPEWQASIDEMYEHGAKVEDVRLCFMDAKALAENALSRNRA